MDEPTAVRLPRAGQRFQNLHQSNLARQVTLFCRSLRGCVVLTRRLSSNFLKTVSSDLIPDRGARRPTMRDVAAVAGVSLATVSRVVNSSGGVRPDLAEKVNAA